MRGPDDTSHDWPHRALLWGPSVSPHAEVLRDLMRWTGGSADLVAQALGASRRSVYNWLTGKPVRSEFATRAERLQAVLEPLTQDWHPQAVAQWLQVGNPPPAQLASEESWAAFHERVLAALRPLSPQPIADEPLVAGSLEPWAASALLTVLEEFNSPPLTPGRRSTWRPRELTGSMPEPEEE